MNKIKKNKKKKVCIFQPVHLQLLNPHPATPSLTVPPTASSLNDTFCSAPCKWFEDPSNGSPVAAAEHQEEHHPTTPPNQNHHAKQSRLPPQDAFPTRCHIEQ